MKFAWSLLLSLLQVCASLGAVSPSVNAVPRDFTLATADRATPFLIEPGTDRAVVRAANDVRADLERVTGVRPQLRHELSPHTPRTVVIAGILGKSPLIDQLAAAGKLDIARLTGAWESFVIQVVPQPYPGVDQALVIAGSDRRGAIYGLYEISAAAGVSPWNWWADVTPQKKSAVIIPAGRRRFGPPSVKYRGVFLNDEDWGLQPWAAKTFEPETGNIGPKTYAKLFELLLRLKANTLWPAMHPGTKPFNAFPENAVLADDYGIVMGSSHAEPMLRNNVGEWTAPPADYNYLTNRVGVLRYWEQRAATNGKFENIYTLGMRGIHDSNMQGPKTDAERIRLLEKIFTDQRKLIARYVQPGVERVPQMFCAYKEVLDLYRQGLRVPEDVTIVWPDDNFGYVRNAATPEERKRPGGFGIYYHVSYLGRPLSYLWLCTTPPALVWEEMHKAYEHGADRMWIVNVGDLKPAEIPTEFFFQMAWDINRWRPGTLANFLPEWAAREFGGEHAAEIAALVADYYVLNFQRKPEHLQWWLPRQTPRPSEFTDEEVQERLDAFAQLRTRADALRSRISPSLQDAFYELVYYPITGSALANTRFFEGERGHPDVARAADAQLTEETRFFNEDLAGGKWRHVMALEPADNQWSSMRLARWAPPDAARAAVASPAAGTYISLNAARFTADTPSKDAAWTIVPGLGRTGEAVTVLPSTMPALTLSQAAKFAPRLDFPLAFPGAGSFPLQVHLLPSHPLVGGALRIAVALDDAAPQLLSLEIDDGGPGWAQGVLDEVRTVVGRISVSTAGQHTLHLYGIEPGVIVEKVVVDLGGLTPTYLGPKADGTHP